MRNILHTFALFGILGALALQAREVKPAPPFEAPYQIQWHLQIPMRDGVKLNGVVYRPSNQTQSLPVILTLTPYTLAYSYKWAQFFASNGYVFVSVDVRGRGDSAGQFSPFVQEPQDGYDTVEWLAQQPWCNGKVGMTGLSYLGGDQWATVKSLPPHLATIVPVAAVHTGVDMPTIGGIDFMQTMQWLIETAGKTYKNAAFSDEDYANGITRDFIQSGRPFKELDDFMGYPSSVFQAWVKHPSRDAFWDSATPSETEFRRLDIPILTITGHYDDDQFGSMAYYRDHMQYGSEATKARHYLVIGPWDHRGTRTPKKEHAGAVFGDAAMVDMNALHKAWFDWTLKGGPKPDFLKKRVACYIQGQDAWRYVDRLEDLAPGQTTYYLQADNVATPHAGKLQTTPPGPENSQQITHNPLDLGPLSWDREPAKAGLLTLPDATMIMDSRQFHHRALSFQSDPLTEATTLCGSSTFTVWVRMDVPDEDFYASLFEVKPDGSTLQLTWDLLRARYRNSFRTETLVKPGEPTRLVFRNFPIVGRTLAKGSRLKLVFGPLDLPAAQRNFHSGKVVSDETPKDARVAHVEVLHDAAHPATLLLPMSEKK